MARSLTQHRATIETFQQTDFAEMIQRVRSARPEYAAHFAVSGLDLRRKDLWAGYVRQSTEEQLQNNSIPQYLDTIAENAVKHRVIIPLEYLFYDNDSGTHLERPAILKIRDELMPDGKLAGILFPNIDRLSRNATHAEIFENYCEHYHVKYWYCNLPENAQGTEPTAKLIRRLMGEMAAAQAHANRDNNRRGRIGLILNGNVPPGPVPLGYKYCKREEGGRKVASWHELDGAIPGASLPLPLYQLQHEVELQGYLVPNSPAYIAALIFYLSVRDGLSAWRIADTLNKRGIPSYFKSSNGWSHSAVLGVLRKTNYYGDAAYNKAAWGENPKARFSGDVTAAKRRTVLTPKDTKEWKWYKVPPLLDKHSWQLAQETIERHRVSKGRSKPVYEAWLRGVIVCPICLRHMRYHQVRQGKHRYYVCSMAASSVAPGWSGANPCDFRTSIRANEAEAKAKNLLRALLQRPEKLQEYADTRLADTSEGTTDGAYQYQLEKWQQKLKDTDSKMERLSRGWVNGTIDDALYGAMKTEIEREREDAADTVERFRHLIEDKQRVRRTIAEIVEAIKSQDAIDIDNIAVASRFMQNLQMAYIPTGDRDGTGTLVAFFNPADYEGIGADVVSTMANTWTHCSRGGNTILPAIPIIAD